MSSFTTISLSLVEDKVTKITIKVVNTTIIQIMLTKQHDTTQNMKYVTCITCVNPIIMFSLQAASTTHTQR